MIFNISGRSDIVAFYSDWFFHRLKEGYVYVRNPYYPTQITKYLINEDVVDCFVFCTKNPRPILSRLDELKPCPSFFYITITPYGKQIEPYVPPYQDVIFDIQKLSLQLGVQSVGIRYDPIFINQEYTIEKHLYYFEDAIVVDKVIGKATAMLLILSKVKYIYAYVLSEKAKEILEYYHISYDCEKVVPYIINRTHDGMCPMEKTVYDLSLIHIS